MKKLMIAAAVAMLGIAANAMAVDWKYTGAKADAGSTVYVILGTTDASTLTSLAAIQNAAISSSIITKSGTKYTASETASSEAITKSSANIYYIIVDKDEKKFAVSEKVDASGSVYDAENKESSPGIFSDIESVGSYSDFSGAAPEPTSAMLMLLGVAGLALRRRRA